MQVRRESLTNIWELDRVLNEKDRDVVAHDVPVALLGVELDGEPANISHGVGAATTALHGGEAQENRGLARGIVQDFRIGVFRRALEKSEFAKGRGSSCVDDSLRNALLVKAMDL